jgi:dTDP-4-amino-4,6-dideoxygalactose transaminase
MHFRFPLRLPGGLASVADRFASRGVTVRRGVNVLLHRVAGHDDGAFPTACRLLDTTVMLPIYPALSEDEHLRCREAAVSILPAAVAAAG